ncbi:MAG TPA: NAD(P)H-dependent oxidoreductase [Candidatus Sabulitectum sp.]|nr:NAD(P)H-dependent oxidoreductase [Candidatus Sabulitectum sp.]HPJ27409.1 NAD(P)H-dependent oxidoreductase [Candidatus Sabulitectum sp.]HPR22756.1 NAD(P)H-dependent oxidoreductase [Candidatus Sabulitectum sp.]HRW77251.1 NAD(P)H-dependent oxidoreductase [Candidatus Sabulitectum sp.]
MIRLVAFAGSSRRGSFNRKLVRIAAEGASSAGAQVEILELSEYPMPLMNEDLEAEKGMPEAAGRFKRKLLEADGFIISAPEYNSSMTPLLKNSLDWASRSETPDEKPLSAYRGKTAVLMSASPGSLGGMRGLVPLRLMLMELGVTVLPVYRCISSANEAFEEDGSLKNGRDMKAVMGLGAALCRALERGDHGEG